MTKSPGVEGAGFAEDWECPCTILEGGGGVCGSLRLTGRQAPDGTVSCYL